MRFSLVMACYDTDQNNAKGQVQEVGTRTCLRSSHVYLQVVFFSSASNIYAFQNLRSCAFFGEPASLLLDFEYDTGNFPI